MAYEDRSYSGNAVTTTLTSNITNVATTIPILASTGWPDGTGGPFHAGIAPANDPDNYTEVIRCSGRTGLTLNVQITPVTGRGWDGTTAAAHLTGSVIRHVFTATDAEEANQHIVNTGLDHHTAYLTVARHDISGRHGFGVLPTAGTPSTSVVGDTASSGASNNVARVDHKHAREVFGSPVSAGPTNSDGAATSISRSNHVHAGGVPILTSSTRPSSPITGESIIESDTKRIMMWTGAAWVRGPHFAGTNSRTGVYVARLAAYSVPDGGASSHILPWGSELFDSDGFIPTPDGTTTTIITVPADTAGMYTITAYVVWASYFSQRSYTEIVHGFSGGGFNQHRVSLTDEDRGTASCSLDLVVGDTIQLGVWQNSGAPVNVNAYLTMYRLFR